MSRRNILFHHGPIKTNIPTFPCLLRTGLEKKMYKLCRLRSGKFKKTEIFHQGHICHHQRLSLGSRPNRRQDRSSKSTILIPGYPAHTCSTKCKTDKNVSDDALQYYLSLVVRSWVNHSTGLYCSCASIQDDRLASITEQP